MVESMEQPSANRSLLSIEELKTHFPIRHGLWGRIVGQVKAVDGVSFDIPKHKTVGLVGESGCGKTTLGRSLLRLIEPTSGRVEFDGIEVLSLRGEELRRIRRRMQVVFQDPYCSLNPRITVGGMLAEILKFHRICFKSELQSRVAEILDRVGLSPQFANRYPHEFSGGQRQRIGIARALAVNPDFIMLDEPVSALDVSIQAQILNLLMDLQEQLGLTYLFIAHDLSVVEHIADEIAVMYLGRVVEHGTKADVIRNPLHPYTQALLASIPHPDPDLRKEYEPLKGDVPSPAHPPSGCHFHPRCLRSRPECSSWNFHSITADGRHSVACILYEPV